MSRIREIIDKSEELCDRGYPSNEYSRIIMMLEALDVIADALLSLSKEIDEEEACEYCRNHCQFIKREEQGEVTHGPRNLDNRPRYRGR